MIPLRLQQDLQVFAIRAAARPAEPPPSYRNFLIIAPEPAAATPHPALTDERVIELAHHLNHDGYAYVARSNQQQMEDDASGVRFMPLSEMLPSFGIMTAVIVINDPAWAARAAAAYPDADIFMLQHLSAPGCEGVSSDHHPVHQSAPGGRASEPAAGRKRSASRASFQISSAREGSGSEGRKAAGKLQGGGVWQSAAESWAARRRCRRPCASPPAASPTI